MSNNNRHSPQPTGIMPSRTFTLLHVLILLLSSPHFIKYCSPFTTPISIVPKTIGNTQLHVFATAAATRSRNGTPTATTPSSENGSTTSSSSIDKELSNIRWKLRPVKGTPIMNRIKLKCAGNLIRLNCFMRRRRPPALLCPAGGQAVLEVYVDDNDDSAKHQRKQTQIARFGITTKSGPPCPEILQTLSDTSNVADVGVAAIIYMYIDPNHRGRGVGERALQVIRAIHAHQKCEYTVLVADDDGSGKLVKWYERNGFRRAPLLQEVMGSPGGSYGITMIGERNYLNDGFFEECPIKWW